MAVQKIRQQQIKANVTKILNVIFNNGTGTRSSTTSASPVAMPGATGDTSYTAPADQDVDIFFTMTQMANPVTGTGQIWISINGASYGGGAYMEPAGPSWKVHTVICKYQLAAGATITIGARWQISGGTFTVTNATGDASFPNEIIGLVVPRAV